jgi:hypothetical protein
MASAINLSGRSIVILSVSMFLVILISCCVQQSTPENTATCNKPYIKVGADCCLDKNDNNICDKDETDSFDISKIEVSPSDFNLDLYAGGQGGPSYITKYVTIKNNNDKSIDIYYGCEGYERLQVNNAIRCIPFIDQTGMSKSEERIEAHSSKSVTFYFYAGRESVSQENELKTESTKIQIILSRVDDAGNVKDDGRAITQIPVYFSIHGAP